LGIFCRLSLPGTAAGLDPDAMSTLWPETAHSGSRLKIQRRKLELAQSPTRPSFPPSIFNAIRNYPPE
jgi:hypothetical protein